MRIEINRMIITDLTKDMKEAIHFNSLDDDNRRFVPDEAFETIEDAYEAIDPTYKKISFEALESFKVEKGKIVESWGCWPDKEIEYKLSSK